jgi:thymidylate synthase
MHPVYIEAIDLNEAWWRCMKEVLAVGREYVIQKGSFEGHKRKEFDLVTIRIECPGIRPLTPITPPGVTPPCDMAYIEGEYLNYLMSEYVAPEELYTYGQDLGYQIPKVIEMLKKTPQTNTACMSVGSRLSIDLEHSQCLRLVHCQVKEGMLHFIVYFRSWDLWGGFPANLAGLQLVKEHMAREIGIADGELLCVSGGLHLYDHTWEWANQIINGR